MGKVTNRRVYQTIEDKRAWEEPFDPDEIEHQKAIGTKGWYTRGYLPHFDNIGAIQMLSFRLVDAMPAIHRHEWEALLAISDDRERLTQLEAYVDRGYGECLLKDRRAATAVENVMLRYDGDRYRLIAWVVMPNHVHALVESWKMPMGNLLKAWKGASANSINKTLGRKGTVWQVEYFDRYVRDEAHFRKAKHYIESNPVKTHLVTSSEEWPFGSANARWKWNAADLYCGDGLVKEA